MVFRRFTPGHVVWTVRQLGLQLLFATGLRATAGPQQAGMARFHRTGWWPLQPSRCPCDLQLVELLRTRGIGGRTIFHFGTGAHHYVGLQNRTLASPNQILGITASAREHQAYVDLAIAHRDLGKTYKVWFADIYTLTAALLPSFDIVTLFHLCEYTMPDDAAFVHHDDESLLRLFVSKLAPGGFVCFYTGSYRWSSAQPIVERLERDGVIHRVDAYESLVMFGAGPR